MTLDSTGSPFLTPPPSPPTVLRVGPEPPCKTCRDCHALKPLDAFPSHRNTADRRSPYCRVCSSARIRQWRKENPEAQAKIQSRYLLKRKLRSIAE